MLRLVIFGRQGAGKGTQAAALSAHYNAPHISTGDILRDAVASGTEIGLKAKAAMDDAIARRDAALKSFDDALDKLNASAKAALEQFLGTAAGVKGAKAMGGLAKFAPASAAKGATASAVSHGLIGYAHPDARQLRRA